MMKEEGIVAKISEAIVVECVWQKRWKIKFFFIEHTLSTAKRSRKKTLRYFSFTTHIHLIIIVVFAAAAAQKIIYRKTENYEISLSHSLTSCCFLFRIFLT